MYWYATSGPDGNGEEIVTWWKSLLDDICNSHERGCYQERAQCKMVYTRQGFNAHIYIYICMELCCVPTTIYSCYTYKISTKVCEKLYDVICNVRLLEDINRLSPHQQTSSLENYHPVINHFAPTQAIAFFLCRDAMQVYE